LQSRVLPLPCLHVGLFAEYAEFVGDEVEEKSALPVPQRPGRAGKGVGEAYGEQLGRAYLEVAQRLEGYLKEPNLPLFLWLRLVVGEQLINLHRHHLGAQMRDAGLEVSLYRGALPEASSAALAAQLLGKHTSPTQAAVRAERLLRIQGALNSLDPLTGKLFPCATLNN
jgi:hypothetical protein